MNILFVQTVTALNDCVDVPLLLAWTGHLGDNCIQNFHLGRYIVRYTVGNFVLRRRYTAPNENFEYGYPHSNVLFYF